MPLLRIAADLGSRGHDVVVVTGSLFRESVENSGLRFVGLPGIANYDVERQQQVMEGRAHIAPGPAQLDYDFTHAFYEPIPEQHATLQSVLAEAPDEPTTVITDQSFMGQWPVLLGAAGIVPAATIVIGVVPLPMNSVDTAPFGLGLPPDATEEGRARNKAQNAMVEEMFSGSTGFLRATLEGLGATESIGFPMDGIVKLPDRYLQLSVGGVEYPRSDAPGGLRFVGSLPAETAGSRSLPDWWDEVLTADRVVVVTQGTLANRDLSLLIEPALRALADLDALVVVTTGRDDDEGVPRDVPANARIASFIPYDALLPHADVLVTNGGYGGSLQALGHGVPLVIAGATEDKVEVAARLAWTGAAVNLATETPGQGEIAAAVLKVLDDVAFREHAGRLREESLRHDAFEEVARTVEELNASRRGDRAR